MLLSFGERRDAGSPERTQAMDFEASLPSQPSDEAEVAAFWNTVRRAQPISPERDLMRAVLKDALLRFRKNLHHPADRRFKAERAWFFESDGDELFSFESVCAVLGLNARRIRRNLLDWEAQAGRAACRRPPLRALDVGASSAGALDGSPAPNDRSGESAECKPR